MTEPWRIKNPVGKNAMECEDANEIQMRWATCLGNKLGYLKEIEKKYQRSRQRQTYWDRGGWDSKRTNKDEQRYVPVQVYGG